MATSKTLSQKITESSKITAQTKKRGTMTAQENHPIKEANTMPIASQKQTRKEMHPESLINDKDPLHDKPISRGEKSDS